MCPNFIVANDIEYIYLDIQLCSNLMSKCAAKIKNEAIAVYYELIHFKYIKSDIY